MLLRRYGYSEGTRWRFMALEVKDPEAGTDVAKVSGKLQGEGYDLFKPGPVPIGENTAGPFPGLPDLAEKADDPS